MKTYSSLIMLVSLFLGMSACSTNSTNSTSEQSSAKKVNLNVEQKVELGTVVAVNTLKIKAEEIKSYGNVGVAAGSGGFRGIYGSIDMGTLARIFRNTTGPKTAQEVIVKKTNGEIVSITQLKNEEFKKGDAVKIVLRKGEARVIH